MKTTLCVFLLACVQVFGAAPESLAGKVYRSFALLSGITNAVEGTIILGNDGRYIVLKRAFGVMATLGPSNTLPDVHWSASCCFGWRAPRSRPLA